MAVLDDIKSTALQLAGSGLTDEQQAILNLLCGAAGQELALRLRPGICAEDCGDSFVAAAALTAVAAYRAAQSERISGFDAGGVSVTLRDDGNAMVKLAQILLAPWCGDGLAFRGVRS